MTLESIAQIAAVVGAAAGAFAGAFKVARATLGERKNAALKLLSSASNEDALPRIEGKIDGVIEMLDNRFARLETRVSRTEQALQAHIELHRTEAH